MRRKEFSINIASAYQGQCNLEYPDEVVFVFNPLYLNININAVGGVYKVGKAEVSVQGIVDKKSKTHTIQISLYKGKGRVYLSRIMELFFDDVRNLRHKTIKVQLIVSGSVVWQESFMAIWGNVAIGDRLAHYGAFKFDKQKPYWERRRIWFKNFPFMVSMFAQSYSNDDIPLARYDGRPYEPNAMVHCPNVDFIFDSTEEENIQAIAPSMEGSSLEYIAYVRNENRFYGMTDDFVLARNWTPNPPYLLGDESYNDANTDEAKEGMVCSYANRIMRYSKEVNGLVDVPYGNGGQVGIYEAFPHLVFPDAVSQAILKQKGKQTSVSKSSTFDRTFDYTFFTSGEMATITKLIIDHSMSGTYLRWIDRLGMYQFFLFTEGKTSRKSKLSADVVTDDYPVGGMYFANHERTAHVECEVTSKCAALMLEQDIYDYVSTIVTSPIIDMYLGKNNNGDELWVPVNVEASNYEYDPKAKLHDLEIELSLPSINAQTL